MRNTANTPLIVILLATFSLSLNPEDVSAQNDSLPRPGINRTWIGLNKDQVTRQGVLYEIKYSSVLISFSMARDDYRTGNFRTFEIPYYDIDNIRIRGKNRIAAGTLIGFSLGMGAAYTIAKSASGSREELFGALVIYGTPVIGLCTGIGALMGTARISIPIKGDYVQFKGNESRLERRSYVQEYDEGLNVYEKGYEHKWFAGFIYKVTFPSGDFTDPAPEIPEDKIANIGGGAGIILGVPVTGNFGFTASLYNSTFIIPSSSEKYWVMGEYMAGPFWYIHLNRQMIIDLKPLFGVAMTEKYNGDVTELSGAGPGINLCTGYRYNFARRWCLMADAGYMMAWQKIRNEKQFNSTFNLGAGLAYRFR